MAVTVYTTTGNTWELARGVTAETSVSPTGELAAEVFSSPTGSSGPAAWLGSFGSVEAVYADGEAVLIPAAASRGI